MTTKHLEKGLPRAGSRGFSLVEVMVYIFILVFMLVVVIEVVVSITRASRIISSARAIENSAVLSIERLTREMRLANSVVVASSTLAVHPGRLTLTGEDDEGDPRTVEFYLSGGRILMKENNVDLGALTESDVVVTNLIFQRFATSTTEGIRTQMRLESGTSTHYRTETFYSTSLVR